MMISARWVRGALVGITATAALLALTAAAWAATSSGKGHAGAMPTATSPRCAASQLGVWVAADYAQVALGSTFIPLEFTNVSHRTCTLRGVPAVAARGRNGHQLGPAAIREHGPRARTVTLAPGRTAHATFRYVQAVASNCPAAKQTPAVVLKVSPPHRTKADHALFDFETCPGNTAYMAVAAIQAGTLGF